MAELPHVVLKDEGPSAARVLRYELPDGAVVLKEWLPHAKSRLMRAWARLQMRREIRHYRDLDGTPGVPRYRGHEGHTALFIEFVEARALGPEIPQDEMLAALDGLDATLDALHARRFAHLDLHQRLNALIDASGRAWVIDLGQGLDCSRGWLRRPFFPLLAKIDRNGVLKFRARYAPQTLDPARRDRIIARFAPSRERWPKRLGRMLRRLVLDEQSSGA